MTASLAGIPGIVNGAKGNDHRSNKPVVARVTSQPLQKHFCSIDSYDFSGIEFNVIDGRSPDVSIGTDIGGELGTEVLWLADARVS